MTDGRPPISQDKDVGQAEILKGRVIHPEDPPKRVKGVSQKRGSNSDRSRRTPATERNEREDSKGMGVPTRKSGLLPLPEVFPLL